MKIVLISIFSLFLLSIFSTTSFAFDIGAKGTYWLPEIDGNIRVDDSSTAGTDIDLNDDFGFEDENFTLLNVLISGNKHHLELSYADFDFTARNRLTRNIIFNGQQYSIDEEIHSFLNFSMIDLYYLYDFINVDNFITKFEVGGIFQVKYLDGEVKITTSGSEEKADFSLPVPMVGLNLKMGMMSDVIAAHVRGTGIAYSEDNLYEIMGEVSWTPMPFLSVYGGYKAFAINVDEDDINLDYNLAGPYAAIELSF